MKILILYKISQNKLYPRINVFLGRYGDLSLYFLKAKNSSNPLCYYVCNNLIWFLSEYDLDLEFADFYPTKQSNPSFETTPPSQPTNEPTNEPTDQFLSEHTNQMMQPIYPTASLADQSVNRSTVSLTEQLVNRSTSNVIINQPSNQQPVFHPANEDQQVNEGPGQLINEGPGQRINEGPGQRINDGPLQRVNEGPVQLIDYATHPIQASEYNQVWRETRF